MQHKVFERMCVVFSKEKMINEVLLVARNAPGAYVSIVLFVLFVVNLFDVVLVA